MAIYAIVIDLSGNEVPSDVDSNIRFLSYHPCVRDSVFNGDVDVLSFMLTNEVSCQLLCHRDDVITSDDLAVIFLNCPQPNDPDHQAALGRMQEAMSELFELLLLKYSASGVKGNGAYTDNSASILVLGAADVLQEQLAGSRRSKFKVVGGTANGR